MTTPLSRRRFLGAAAATGVLAGCSGGHSHRQSGAASDGSGSAHALTIGCVTPMTGPYASIGRVVQASLTAATGHIATDLGGAYNDFRPHLMMADAPLTAAQGQAAYAHLKAAKVDAILWCGAQGLAESLPDIVADLIPVIAVGTDIQSRVLTDHHVPDLTTGSGAGFPVFQTSVPDVGALSLLLEYAGHDRGFTRAGLIFSSVASPGVDSVFARLCRTWGLISAAAVGYDNSAGTPDLTSAVHAMRSGGAQAVVVAGPAEDAASVAALLDGMGARYVDTPSAKQGRFRPMLLGLPAVTTEVFALAAGQHAATGTVGASTLGSVVALPGSPMRGWLPRFVPGYNGGLPQGGEDGPADAVAALLQAAALAESTQGAALVAALESGFTTRFASTVGVQFGASRHLSVLDGELCLQALESSPETRYDLGEDWGAVFPKAYRGSDLLVDFTQARNTAAYSGIVDQVVSLRYGISSQAAYQDGDAVKMSACNAVH